MRNEPDPFDGEYEGELSDGVCELYADMERRGVIEPGQRVVTNVEYAEYEDMLGDEFPY